MTLTHVFFDLHGALADAGRLRPCYNRALGQQLAQRYGGAPDAWAEAHDRVVADWDSYFADLDLGDDESIAQLWEGLTRVLRALFRLAGQAHPPAQDLQVLVREHPYLAARTCDCLYPDVKPALRVIYESLPLTLGVISYAVQGYIAGVLEGAGVRGWFGGPLLGPDTMGRFDKDAAYFALAFARAGVAAAQAVVVDRYSDALAVAGRLGARTVLINRAGTLPAHPAGPTLPDLNELPALLAGWLSAEGVDND